MRIRTKRRIARALVALIVAATLVGIALVVNIQANTTDAQAGFKTESHAGPRTGLYKRGGHWYYGHKTKSALYDVGDVARDCFKIINGKFYYFRHSGKMQTKDSHYIDIRHRDHSVRYIYTPGTKRKERYNTRLHRYQIKKGKKWETVGMECYPIGQLDMQP